MERTQMRFYTSLFTIFTLLLLLLPAGFVIHSLSTETSTAIASGTPPTAYYIKLPESLIAWEQRGIASWYGPRFHGRLTANGEHYNMYAMTAAHKTLPFGSIVKVINRRNGKATLVRINDRGPYIAGRIIDLTYTAAAQQLDFTGIAPVELQLFRPLQPEFITQQRPKPGQVLATFNSELHPIVPLRPVQIVFSSRNFTQAMLQWHKHQKHEPRTFLRILMPEDSVSYHRTLQWGIKRRSTPVFVYQLVTIQPDEDLVSTTPSDNSSPPSM